jgi:antirestriction protein
VKKRFFTDGDQIFGPYKETGDEGVWFDESLTILIPVSLKGQKLNQGTYVKCPACDNGCVVCGMSATVLVGTAVLYLADPKQWWRNYYQSQDSRN